MSLVVLDTDVASAALRKRLPPQLKARLVGESIGITFVSGRPRPVNDTWIAACCLVERLPLATLNTKDFADFAEYEGLELL